MHYSTGFNGRLNAIAALAQTKQNIWLLCVLVALVLGIIRFQDIPVGTFFDDAHYIVLAESLSEGRGYRLINYPSAPIERAFPPGWPLILTPFVALFPNDFALLKLLSFLFWIASIPLAYRLFAMRLPSPYPQLLAALVALNPHLIGASGTVMSEATFLFFSLLTLNLFAYWNQDVHRHKIWLFIVVLFLALCTMAVRTIGLALPAGIVLYLLFQRRYRSLLIVGVLFILGLVPLVWFNLRNGGTFVFSQTYSQHVVYVASQLGKFLRFWDHGSAVSYEIMANALVPVFDLSRVAQLITPGLTHWLSILVLLVVFCGFLLSLRHYRVTEVYVAGYVGILYFWIVYIDEVQPRVLIPIIPFLYFYFLCAVTWFAGHLLSGNKKRTAWLATALTGVLLLLSLARNYYEWRHPIRARVVDLSIGTTWLRENTPPESIVMTIDSVPDYLYMRRQTVAYPEAEAAGDITTYLRRNQVDYIMVRPSLNQWDKQYQLDAYTTSQLLPFLLSNPEQFREVYRNADHNVLVYQVLLDS